MTLTQTQVISGIAFSGGILLCPYPMAPVSMQSRGRLEMGSRWVRYCTSLHCVHTACSGIPVQHRARQQ